MSNLTASQSKKQQQQRAASSESESDHLTDDFSDEDLFEKQIKEDNDDGRKSKVQKTMRNVPIPVATLSNAMVRTIYTILMLLAFIGIIMSGPMYCALLIVAITAGIFREIINIKRKLAREVKIPSFIMVNWYFFLVGMFYFYGSFVTSNLQGMVSTSNETLKFMWQYHKFISFILWVVGFLGFVMSLKQGFYRYQFRLFGWTHLTLLIVVTQTSVIVINLYQGLVWFILPALLVIINDIFAYIFGKLFGKHKLIALSPNKTWEGFIGGFFSSFFFALLFSYIFQQHESLVCVNSIQNIQPFLYSTCKIPEVFITQQIVLPEFLQNLLGGATEYLHFSMFQKHSLVLSLFASLIAPFGGFFASGMKRALDVKDFGSAIPGHGGITDRMDCQLLMGTFTFFYLKYVVLQESDLTSVTAIVAAFKLLSQENQQQTLQQILSVASQAATAAVSGTSNQQTITDL